MVMAMMVVAAAVVLCSTSSHDNDERMKEKTSDKRIIKVKKEMRIQVWIKYYTPKHLNNNKKVYIGTPKLLNVFG